MATERNKTTTDAAAGKGGEERSPEQIQAEIEATREEMGDTVAEVADKADVKKQAKRKASETKAKAAAKKDEVKQKATAQKDAVTGKVKEASPDSAQQAAQQAAAVGQQAAAQATQAARQNPVPTAAIAAFVGGLVIGWTLGHR